MELDNLSTIGRGLRSAYASGAMLKQVLNLQRNLHNDPPFPRNWQKESAIALAEIEGRFNRSKILSFKEIK